MVRAVTRRNRAHRRIQDVCPAYGLFSTVRHNGGPTCALGTCFLLKEVGFDYATSTILTFDTEFPMQVKYAHYDRYKVFTCPCSCWRRTHCARNQPYRQLILRLVSVARKVASMSYRKRTCDESPHTISALLSGSVADEYSPSLKRYVLRNIQKKSR